MKNKINIKGFLFDLDGTLIQSMYDHFIAWKKTFIKYGVEIHENDYYPLEGSKLSEIVKTSQQLEQRIESNAEARHIEELVELLASLAPRIRVFVCGGCGCNTVQRLSDEGLLSGDHISGYAVNTDAQHLLKSKIEKKK